MDFNINDLSYLIGISILYSPWDVIVFFSKSACSSHSYIISKKLSSKISEFNV